jgi:protein-S-isoprenylcysteine O-methyltransferase Ste14
VAIDPLSLINMPLKVWIALGIEFLVFALLLFLAAGTIMWTAGWAFLILFFGGAMAITLVLARLDPALLDERMKPPIQPGQPLWDRIFLCAVILLWLGWLILMGLDAVRFRWSVMPIWLQLIGLVGIALSFWICYRTFRENTFLAPVVRIQKERGHKVISTGPYSIVRHPLYSAVLIMLPSTGLMLGSWYGLASSFLINAAIVFRTWMEDDKLKQELDGYADYAVRVRYRLLPFVW